MIIRKKSTSFSQVLYDDDADDDDNDNNAKIIRKLPVNLEEHR